MSGIPFAFQQGSLVCTLGSCSQQLSFNTYTLLAHYDGTLPDHPKLSKASLLAFRQSLALQFFEAGLNSVACIPCNVQLPSVSVESINWHLVNCHDLRSKSDLWIDTWLKNARSQPRSSSSRVPLLAHLTCPAVGCDYTTPIVSGNMEGARSALYYHLRYRHRTTTFTGTLSLADRARLAGMVMIPAGLKRQKLTNTDADEDDVEVPDGGGSLSTTHEFAGPLGYAEAEVAVQASARGFTVAGSSTTRVTTSTTSASPTTFTRTTSGLQPVSLPIVPRSSLSTVARKSTKTTLRDDPIIAAMSAIYAPIQLHPHEGAPLPPRLCDEAIRLASAIYKKLSWWVVASWYGEVCTEGAMHWYLMCSAKPTAECANEETLSLACQQFIKEALRCAELGRAIHPGIAGGLSSTTAQNASDDNDFSFAEHRQYGISMIQEETVIRYSQILVRVLQYLNNRAIDCTGGPMFTAAMDDIDSGVNAGYILQVIYKVEWLPAQIGAKMGIFTQALAAMALIDGRNSKGHDQELGPPDLADLRLQPASFLATASSALMYIIKCVVIIVRLRGQQYDLKEVLFDKSRSGQQLAAVRRDYDFLPETKHAFEAFLKFDVVESVNRGNTPVILLSPPGDPNGSIHIGIAEVSAAVTHATSKCCTALHSFLSIMNVPDEIVQLLAMADTDRAIRFVPGADHIGIFHEVGEAGEENSATVSMGDLGTFITGLAESYRQLNQGNIAGLQVDLQVLEDNLIFLVHVVSGGPGRAQDMFDLMLARTPNAGHIRALTKIALEIQSIVHKKADLQHQEKPTITRYPNYSTCKLLATFVSIIRGLYPGHQRLWSPSIRNAGDLTTSFSRAASDCFKSPFQFNWWRHIAQLLIARGYQSLTVAGSEVALPGSRSLELVVSERFDNSGAPSIPNRLTLQFGHSLMTAASNYGTKSVSTEGYQEASMAYQRFLHVNTRAPPTVVSKQAECCSCLWPKETLTEEQRVDYVRHVLVQCYPAQFRNPTMCQLDMVRAILTGASDVIVIGGCGTGKSAAYLAAGLASASLQRCILILCPQNNVQWCAAAMLLAANVKFFTLTEQDDTSTYLSTLLETQCEALQHSVFVASFQWISTSSYFNTFVYIMDKYKRLAHVVVDEVHICLSALSWRACFSACGNLRQRIGYSVPWTFTTATLPTAAIPAYKEFWHLGLRPIKEIRGPTDIASNVSIFIKRVAGTGLALTRLLQILQVWLTDSASKVRRIMVLMLSIKEADYIGKSLTDRRDTLELQPDDLIATVTASTSEEGTKMAIERARIIVCTTVLSSSMNINGLDAIVVYKSCYSLADLVQAFGRVGRQKQPAQACLLWSAGSHSKMFEQSNINYDDHYLAWMRANKRTDAIRAAFSPEGVKAFAESSGCRRQFIRHVFDGTDVTALNCVDIGASVLCDNCQAELSQATMEPFSDDLQEHEDGSDIIAEQAEGYPTSPILVPTGDEDEFADYGFAPEQNPPRDSNASFAMEIFCSLQRHLDKDAPIGADKVRCLMCKRPDCTGFKDTANKNICRWRARLSVSTFGMLCYGCGGPHPGNICGFRKTGKEQPVVPGTCSNRCYYCYLPQHARGGVTFHPGVANMSGDSKACLKRGKLIFAVLSAGAYVQLEYAEEFASTYAHSVSKLPPILTMDKNDDGRKFAQYWLWLWEQSLLLNDLRNIDIWLAYLFDKVDALDPERRRRTLSS